MPKCKFTYSSTSGWSGPSPADPACNISIGVTATDGVTIYVECSTDPPTLLEVQKGTTVLPFPVPATGQSLLKWNGSSWEHVDGENWDTELKFSGSADMKIIVEDAADPKLVAYDGPFAL